MGLEEIDKINEIKLYLGKSSSHFGGHKFTAMMKNLSNEEKIEVFSDSEVRKKMLQIINYDALSSVFRSVPSEIQEVLWENVDTQKVLLGLFTTSDEELIKLIKNKKFFNFQELVKKEKNGKFYYNSAKLRALEVLLRYVKSSKIIEDLTHNKYFQMILLCSKKVPDSLLAYVDVETLFNETIERDFYAFADKKLKSEWCYLINNNCSKLLLPKDANIIFSPTEYFTNYHWDEKKTLGSLLHTKIYQLNSKNKKLEIDIESLKKLNLQEINILKEDHNDVVNQEDVNKVLEEVIDLAICDGTAFTDKYLSTHRLDVPVQRTMFKMVIDKTIGNPQYEEKMLDYLFKVLFRNEYNELEVKVLKNSLKNALLYASEETVGNLFMGANDIKSAFFLRFNLTARNMHYLHGISVAQLLRINVKHINSIAQLIDNNDNDELSDLYAKAIKMYLVFGLSRSLELLSGRYPINKTFYDNVSRLDASKVEMKPEGKKYLPLIHEDFNRFMFSANNINAIFDEDNVITTTWYYLYNNFEEIKGLCKGHVTLGQAETILKEKVDKVKYELEPDCYRLEKVLYEAGLGNKGRFTNEEIYDEMVNIHRKQIRRVYSTIPYVKGTLSNGWGYEVMPYDSAIAFVLGYRADCCIRTKDIAHNHLLHALLCENGRILLTYKPEGTIASFSPLKRNGEILIANSIEAIDKGVEVREKMIEAFSVGMKEICRVSKENEKDKYLKVATIGSNSDRKPEGEAWPLSIPTPTIYEKNDPIYGETDSYHKRLTIFYKDDKANLQNLKRGEIKEKYLDTRKNIMACVYDRNNVLLEHKILRKINAISYTKWVDAGNDKESFRKIKLGYYDALFCNDDWYVIVDFRGIHYECIEDDPRAKKEMEATIEVINEYRLKREDVRKLVLTMNEKKNK